MTPFTFEKLKKHFTLLTKHLQDLKERHPYIYKYLCYMYMYACVFAIILIPLGKLQCEDIMVVTNQFMLVLLRVFLGETCVCISSNMTTETETITTQCIYNTTCYIRELFNTPVLKNKSPFK